MSPEDFLSSIQPRKDTEARKGPALGTPYYEGRRRFLSDAFGRIRLTSGVPAGDGRPIGRAGDVLEPGVMERDDVHAVALTEYNPRCDALLRKPRANVIDLTKQTRTLTDGVLYDYLRLELDPERT